MTEKTLVQPAGAAEVKAALSPGIISNGFLFVSGAVAFGPDGSIVGEDVTSQTRQTMENIRAILAEAGADFDDVVQTRAYLTRIQEDFTTFDSVYREYFTPPFPARTTIGIELAIPGLLVEVDVVAAIAS